MGEQILRNLWTPFSNCFRHPNGSLATAIHLFFFNKGPTGHEFRKQCWLECALKKKTHTLSSMWKTWTSYRVQGGWPRQDLRSLPSVKCTVPVFHSRSPCNRAGTHPSILLKEAPTCVYAEKKSKLGHSQKSIPCSCQPFFLAAKMEEWKSLEITYWRSMTLWPVFITNTGCNEFIVFNLQSICKINTWRADSVIQGLEKNNQSFFLFFLFCARAGSGLKPCWFKLTPLCHLLSFD